jgi:hypothetical protein
MRHLCFCQIWAPLIANIIEIWIGLMILSLISFRFGHFSRLIWKNPALPISVLSELYLQIPKINWVCFSWFYKTYFIQIYYAIVLFKFIYPCFAILLPYPRHIILVFNYNLKNNIQTVYLSIHFANHSP